MSNIFQCINRATGEIDLEVDFTGVDESERKHKIKVITGDYPKELYKHVFVVRIDE